jgi:hypothetical protein
MFSVWDASQSTEDIRVAIRDEDEYGISTQDFCRAKAAAYKLPPALLPMDLDDPACLDTVALSQEDLVLVDRFHLELEKISLDTCDTCVQFKYRGHIANFCVNNA